MYEPLEYPADSAVLRNGATVTPIVTLENGCGSRYHIGVDDHCFVLYCEREGISTPVTHWFEEAAAALQSLACSPDHAREHRAMRPHLRVVQ